MAERNADARDLVGIDRARPCETLGRRISDGALPFGKPRTNERRRPSILFADRQKRGNDATAFNSLVGEKNLFGQLAVEHLVRVPKAPGHGVLGERFPVQQRHDDNDGGGNGDGGEAAADGEREKAAADRPGNVLTFGAEHRKPKNIKDSGKNGKKRA